MLIIAEDQTTQFSLAFKVVVTVKVTSHTDVIATTSQVVVGLASHHPETQHAVVTTKDSGHAVAQLSDAETPIHRKLDFEIQIAIGRGGGD